MGYFPKQLGLGSIWRPVTEGLRHSEFNLECPNSIPEPEQDAELRFGFDYRKLI